MGWGLRSPTLSLLFQALQSLPWGKGYPKDMDPVRKQVMYKKGPFTKGLIY